jgi:hypothetical protein
MHMAVSLRGRRVLQIFATAALLVVAALGAVRTTAGIQGSGVRVFAAIGPITAVGSGGVSVGGVDYSTSGAGVEIDGHPGKQDQLHTGDVVSLRGTLSQGGHLHKAAASSVTFSSNVRGAVSAVDVPSATFFVLGQTVHVTSDTQFDPSLQPAGLQGLQNGADVEVSGFADAAGDMVASRVSSVGDSGVARVVGTVQNLDPQQKTFNIQSLSVSYANAVVQGTLSDGTSVAVEGPQPAGNDALGATQVNVATALQAQPGAQGRIEGLITDFASANYFEVDGQAVAVSAQTHLNLHVPLGLNVYVRVTGVFDANGTLEASKVQSKASHN